MKDPYVQYLMDVCQEHIKIDVRTAFNWGIKNGYTIEEINKLIINNTNKIFDEFNKDRVIKIEVIIKHVK